MQRPMTKAGTTKLIGQSSKARTQPLEVDTSGNGPEIPEEQWPRAARLSSSGKTLLLLDQSKSL